MRVMNSFLFRVLIYFGWVPKRPVMVKDGVFYGVYIPVDVYHEMIKAVEFYERHHYN